MYPSEKKFMQWMKGKERYMPIDMTWHHFFPDFIVYDILKERFLLVECKERQYHNVPTLSMLTKEQQEWVVNKKFGYVFFYGKKKKKELYQIRRNKFVIVEDFI